MAFWEEHQSPASVSLWLLFSAINFHSLVICAGRETTFCSNYSPPHTLAVSFLQPGNSQGQDLISVPCWYLMDRHPFWGAQGREWTWWQKAGVSVSLPHRKRWIYWFWLGRLGHTCPFVRKAISKHWDRLPGQEDIFISEVVGKPG